MLVVRRLVENIGKIDREPHLRPDPGARDVLAPKHSKIESHSTAELVLPPAQDLELASAQIPVVRKSAVNLTAER